MSDPEGQERPLPTPIDRNKNSEPVFIPKKDRRGQEDITRS